MPEPFLEVGRIERAHGLRGEVVVHLVTNMVAERTAVGAELWAEGRALQVAAARPHGRRWLVRFAGIDDRTGAEELRGSTLTAPPLDRDAEVFVHELIGRRLIDQDGVDHGEIASMVENPAADLLELADGRLVPLTFYRRHDDEQVHVDVPPGLLDD